MTLPSSVKSQFVEIGNTIVKEHMAAEKAYHDGIHQALIHAKQSGDAIIRLYSKVEYKNRINTLNEYAPGIAKRTAQKYVQIAEDWEKIEPRFNKGEIITISAALDNIKASKPEKEDARRALSRPTGRQQQLPATKHIDKTPEKPHAEESTPKPVQQTAPPSPEVQPVRSNVKPAVKPDFWSAPEDDEIESNDQPTVQELLAQIDTLKAENEKLKQQKKPYYGATQSFTCTKCPSLEHELAAANAKIANHYRAVSVKEELLREYKEDADLCNQIRNHLPIEEWNLLMRDIKGEQLVEDEEAA